ncbi:alpha-1,3-galactosidase B [Bacteroidia bacterium]|nr:alpha-1,3-galactosidase B [Bacteroidia bacterium]
MDYICKNNTIMSIRKIFITAIAAGAIVEAAGQTGAGSYHPSWFRTPRMAPITEVRTSKTIDVTALGAKPDDGKDDHRAIERAIEQMMQAKNGVKLYFPKGRYDITPPSGKESHCFTVAGCSDFLIMADGAQIVIHDPAKGFLRMQDCRRGIIKGFGVDYSPLPYTQGVITMVDQKENIFEVKIDEGYPSPLDGNFAEAPTRWASVLTDNGGVITLKRGGPNLVPAQSISEGSDKGVFRIKTSAAAANGIARGDLYALIARYNGRPAFSTLRCRQVTLMENTCYAGPAGGFAIGGSSEIGIIRCNVLRKPGRYISQNADCVHVTPGAIGPWIEGCVFEGQMDDAINLKTEMVNIIEARGPDRFLVTGAVEEGDSLSLFNPREGVLIGRCVVTSAVKEKAGAEIRVSQKFEGIRAGAKDRQADMFFNDNRSNESFVIRGNSFRLSRRYGMLIQATHGTIDGNTFQSTSTGAITLQNSASWPEGFVPRNVHIAGNTIIDCGFDTSYGRETPPAPIIVRTTTVNSGVKASWRGVTGIVIENNVIDSNSAYCISLSGTSGIVIRNNEMIRKGPQSIFRENSDNVIIE